MLKRLVQAFILIGVTGASKALTDQLAPALSIPAVAALVIALGAVALWVLETRHALALNWWWHRFWYLRGLLGYVRELNAFELGERVSGPRRGAEPSAWVLVGERTLELVPFARERLRSRSSAARLLVQGEPGSGKTFAALQVAADLARAAQWLPWRRIPVLVRLGSMREGTLEAYLASEVLKTTAEGSGKVISEGLDHLQRRGRIVLVLDALDEVPSSLREKLLRELGDFAKPSRANVSLLLTSRAREILVAQVDLPLEVLEIQPLDDAGITAFIELYAKREEDADDPELPALVEQAERLVGTRSERVPRARVDKARAQLEDRGLLEPDALGRNPFWLRLILGTRSYDARSRAGLIDHAVDALLAREWSKPDSKRSWSKCEPPQEQLEHTRACLAWLAYQMTASGAVTLESDAAKLLIAECIERRIGTKTLRPDDVLWLGRDALLLDVAHDRKRLEVRFRHRLLQDYFSAHALQREASLLGEHVLESLARGPLWWPALLTLSELQQEHSLVPTNRDARSEFLQTLLGSGADPTGVVLANATLSHMDRFVNRELVERAQEAFAKQLADGPAPELVEAARQLAVVSGEAFVRIVSPIAERVALRPSLIALLADVLRAMVESGTAHGLIVQLFSAHSLREPARDALVSLGERGVESLVRALRQRPSWGVVETLGTLRSPAAVDALLRLLPKAEPFLQIQLIEALGKIGDPRAVGAIAPFVARANSTGDFDSAHMVSQFKAVDALVEIGGPGLDTLFEVLNARDVALGGTYAQSVLKRVDPRDVPRLVAALDHRDLAVRRAVASTFESIVAPAAVPGLGRLLRDRDPTVALDAARALGHQGASAAEVLIAFLAEQPDSLFENQAAKALGKLGPAALSLLLAASSHPQPRVRVAVCTALGQIGDPSARPALEALLASDSEWSVRQHAAQALGAIGDLGANKALLRAFKTDTSFAVRVAAAAGLARLGNEPAHEYLLALLDDPQAVLDEKQRQAVQLFTAMALADIGSKSASTRLERIATECEASGRKQDLERGKIYRDLLERLAGADKRVPEHASDEAPATRD